MRTDHPIIKYGLRIMRIGRALSSQYPVVVRHGPAYLRHALRAGHRRANDLGTYAHLSRTHDRYYYLTLRFLSSDRQPIGVLPVTSWTIDPRRYAFCDRYARLAYTHPNAFFGPPSKLDGSAKTLICDDPNSEALKRHWQKVIHVNYDF